jgi:hypothetical protein
MFERETRREKILEARNKELRLKEKTKGILGLGGGGIMIGGGSGGGDAISKGKKVWSISDSLDGFTNLRIFQETEFVIYFCVLQLRIF